MTMLRIYEMLKGGFIDTNEAVMCIVCYYPTTPIHNAKDIVRIWSS